jgi:hypothetical protein
MRSNGELRSGSLHLFVIALILCEAHGANTGCGDQRSSATALGVHQATWEVKSLVAKYVHVRQSAAL